MELKANGSHDVDITHNYLELAKEFQDLQLYGKAEETLQLALARYRDNPDLLTALSKLYIQLDMLDKAMAVTNRLVKSNDHLCYPFFLRGTIYEKNNQPLRAIREYQLALSRDHENLTILNKLVPLSIHNGKAGAALKLISRYQKFLKKPHLFADLQAEAYLELNEPANAFNKMREALQYQPDNAKLLNNYLKLSIQISRKSPVEVLGVLNMALPNLVHPSEDSLIELEIDYWIYHREFSKALNRVNQILEKKSENYLWRKKRAFLRLETGHIDESMEEFRVLFLQKPTDVEVRKVLENYFLVMDRMDNWHQLLHLALKDHPEQIELFSYLRSIGETTDWLNICELDHNNFVKQVEQLELQQNDVSDITFTKLPSYAMEIFISVIAIHSIVPTPSDLWLIIYNERQKKSQIPPFQLEDLEAAYPVWILALHVYFLFKSFSTSQVSFVPQTFQNDHVAVSFHIDQTAVDIDLSRLISLSKTRVNDIASNENRYRWQWPSFQTHAPEFRGHVTPFSIEDFQKIARMLANDITEAQAAPA